MTVPALSIAFMGVSALLSIGVPIGLWFFFHVKYGAKLVPALVGAAAFVVFALGLKRLMDLLVLRPTANGSTWMSGDQYVFYSLIATCVFEETARFLSFKLLRKRYAGILTALSYGVGHGGIKLILLGGVSTIASIVMSVAANAGQFEGKHDLLAFMELQTTVSTPSAMFLVTGVERMFTLAVHLALSVIVFYSVYENRRLWLYPAAILLHALVDAPAALMQAGALHSVPLVEGVILAFAAMLVALAIYIHRKLKPAEELPDFILDGGAENEET